MLRQETVLLLDQVALALLRRNELVLACLVASPEFHSAFVKEFEKHSRDNRVERYSITPEGEKALEEQDV